MKYLILGVNGMAGHMIALYLNEQGHQVTGFAREKNPVCNTIIGDALDWEHLKKIMKDENYDIVVNGIGILNQAVDRDMEKGIYINSLLPHLIAKELRKKETRFIHISTDCVFNGSRGDYTEAEKPDELSNYGKTKSLGEIVDDFNLTFRTSIIGPELKKDGIGLFHWFMKQTKSVKGFQHVLWTGVTTLELAKAIEAASKQRISGLYHLVNNQFISKYELLTLFQTYCRKNELLIHEEEETKSNKTLVNTRTDFDFSVNSYELMIKEMAEWIQDHSRLYSLYEEQIKR